MDTPETRKKLPTGEWKYDPEPYAAEAKEFNKKMVLGEKVRLEFDVTKNDKYERWLAYVFLPDGRMVNAELVKNGLAVVSRTLGGYRSR